MKIGPKPASVTASTATVEVANPNALPRCAAARRSTAGGNARGLALREAAEARPSPASRCASARRAPTRCARRRRPARRVKLALRRAGGQDRLSSALTADRWLATGGGPRAGPGGSTAAPAPARRRRRRQLARPWPALPRAANRWAGRMGTEGAYDDLEFTLIGGRSRSPRPRSSPSTASRWAASTATRSPSSRSSWPARGRSAPTAASQQSGIAVNQLVSRGSRGITYKIEEIARTGDTVTASSGCPSSTRSTTSSRTRSGW